MSCTTTIPSVRSRVICSKILGQSYRYCYYAWDRHTQRVGAEMVLVVISPLCAGVCVHLKKAYFAYFVAYIPHSRLLVISDIYANICAKIWLARMWFISQVKRFRLWRISQARISRNCLWCISQSRLAMCERFHNIRHSLLVILFTMQDSPDRTNVLTVEQTCYGGLSVGGGWCRVVCGAGWWGGCAVGDEVCVKEGTPLTLCEWKSAFGVPLVFFLCRYGAVTLWNMRVERGFVYL